MIAAVGNGDGRSEESYAGNAFELFNGRALVILRTTRNAGPIKLTASADGMTTASVVVESKPAVSQSELR
jgi:beta-galactosidase